MKIVIAVIGFVAMLMLVAICIALITTRSWVLFYLFLVPIWIYNGLYWRFFFFECLDPYLEERRAQ